MACGVAGGWRDLVTCWHESTAWIINDRLGRGSLLLKQRVVKDASKHDDATSPRSASASIQIPKSYIDMLQMRSCGKLEQTLPQSIRREYGGVEGKGMKSRYKI